MKNPAFAAIAAFLLTMSAAAEIVKTWDKLEGEDSLIAERRTVVVADQEAWEALWSEHASDASAPAVDFSKENVAAVFLGEKHLGVKLEVVVQDDMIDPDRLNVFYKEVPTGYTPAAFIARPLHMLGVVLSATTCKPFVMVKVRKASIISFETNQRMSIREHMLQRGTRADVRVQALLVNLPSFDGR